MARAAAPLSAIPLLGIPLRVPLLVTPLLAIALLAGCAHRPLGPDGNPLWALVETEHFLLRADLAAEDATAAALQLERVREALLAGPWQAKAEQAGRISVVLLADEAELRRFARRGVSGFAASDAFDGPLIVSSAQQSPSELPVLKHELAHHLANSFLLRQPRWVSEGLASYLETLRLHDDGTATIGEPHQGRLIHLRQFPRLDLARVLAMGGELLTLPDAEVGDFYAQSWALVHYLTDLLGPAFDAYLHRLARAEDPAVAWRESFPELTPPALELELTRYLALGRFGVHTFSLPAATAHARVRPLATAEVHALCAELHWIAFGQDRSRGQAAAEAEAVAALQLDPADPLAAQVWLLSGQRTPEERLALARRLVTSRPQDPRSWGILARELGNGAVDEAERRRALEERTLALETAVRLVPLGARAENDLAWDRTLHGRAEEALPLAQHAAQLSPGNPAFLDTQAVALGELGRCAEAAGLEQRALESVPDGAPAETTERLRARLAQLGQPCRAAAQARAAAKEAAEKAQADAEASARALADIRAADASSRAGAAALLAGRAPGVWDPALQHASSGARHAGPCKTAGPLVPPGALGGAAEVTVEYRVEASGHVTEVQAVGQSSPELVRAIRDYLQGCPFEPSRRFGAAIPSRLAEKFSFRRAR